MRKRDTQTDQQLDLAEVVLDLNQTQGDSHRARSHVRLPHSSLRSSRAVMDRSALLTTRPSPLWRQGGS